MLHQFFFFFFFNDTATTEIYTLSLHDALPILRQRFALFRQLCQFLEGMARAGKQFISVCRIKAKRQILSFGLDRKSTRLNSSHLVISYAVFCLKKKNTKYIYDAAPVIPYARCH